MFDRRALQMGALLLLSVVFILLMVQTYQMATRPIGYDFASYLESAEAMSHGHDPYRTGSPFPYIYPHFLAFTLIPLTWIPYTVAVVLWYLFSVAALVYSTRFSVVAAGGDWSPRLLVPLTVLALLMANVLQSNLRNGQVNLLVLLCCILFLQMYANERRTLAAIALAAGIAIKLVPATLIVFLLVRRARSLAAITLLLAVVFCVAPGLVCGIDVWGSYADYGRIAWGEVADAQQAMTPGRADFTLASFVSRLVPGIRGSIWLSLGCALAVLFAAGAVDRLTRLRRSERIDLSAFSLYLLATHLILPKSGGHHLVLIIPAVIVGLTPLWQADEGRRSGSIWATLLVLIALNAARLQAHGPWHFLALVCLFVTVAWTMFTARQTESTTP